MEERDAVEKTVASPLPRPRLDLVLQIGNLLQREDSPRIVGQLQDGGREDGRTRSIQPGLGPVRSLPPPSLLLLGLGRPRG